MLHSGISGHDHADLGHAENERQQDRQAKRHFNGRSAAFVACDLAQGVIQKAFLRGAFIVCALQSSDDGECAVAVDPSHLVANIGVKVLLICTVR